MSDQEYTRKDLDKMNRLQLRRICKERGMKSDDAATRSADELIDFILGAEAEPKKAEKGKAEKGKGRAKLKGKNAEPKKAEPKKGRAKLKGKKAEAEPEAEPETEPTGETELDTSELATALMDRFDELEKRIDTIGQVVDQNFQDLTEYVAELRVDTHQLKAGITHTYKHFQAEEILQDENAPDEMDIDDALTAAEEECQEGNDEGDGEE